VFCKSTITTTTTNITVSKMVALVCVFQDTRTQDYFISGFQMAEIIYIVDLSIFWKHVMLLADDVVDVANFNI